MSKRAKLTDSYVGALRASTERYEVWDSAGRGFGVRVGISGCKTFVAMFRVRGEPKARRLTIGTYPDLSVTKARQRFEDAIEKARQGEDPGLQQAEAQQAERTADTMADLIEVYLEKHAKPNKKSWKQDEYLLNRYVKPALGSRKAKDIKPADMIALTDDIVKEGHRHLANRVHSVARKMFRFALARRIIEHSPLSEVDRPGGKEKPKQRALEEQEIRTLFAGLPQLARPVALAIQLMLRTGQRPGEVASATWSEFDMDRGAWYMAPERTKSGRPHIVPLVPAIRMLLAEIRKIKVEGEDWLFPSRDPRRKEQPIEGASVSAMLLEAIRPKRGKTRLIEMDRFTPHDLRRTCNSYMAALGIPEETRKRVLNHAPTGTNSAVYDVHDYLPERAAALTKWNDHLDAILSGQPGAKVIQLRAYTAA